MAPSTSSWMDKIRGSLARDRELPLGERLVDKGNPVFAYKITSHFDRQRDYNPATGEQTNVLLENTTDRPWYQREYMRVDWRSNVAQNVMSSCTNAKSTACRPRLPPSARNA